MHAHPSLANCASTPVQSCMLSEARLLHVVNAHMVCVCMCVRVSCASLFSFHLFVFVCSVLAHFFVGLLTHPVRQQWYIAACFVRMPPYNWISLIAHNWGDLVKSQSWSNLMRLPITRFAFTYVLKIRIKIRTISVRFQVCYYPDRFPAYNDRCTVRCLWLKNHSLARMVCWGTRDDSLNSGQWTTIHWER